MLGDAAVTLDPAGRSVVTASGAEIAYDHLVLATGSAPFVPPVPGRDLAGVFVYRTLDDVDAIRAWAAGCERGVVVGGGLLGLEAAGALRALGVQSTVVELADWLMAVQVDAAGGPGAATPDRGDGHRRAHGRGRRPRCSPPMTAAPPASPSLPGPTARHLRHRRRDRDLRRRHPAP